MPSDHRQSNASDYALENPIHASLVDTRQGGHFIDDEALLEWSEESADEDEIDDGIDDGYDDNRAEDEDWGIAEGGMLIMNKYLRELNEYPTDFTKQYNRLRQHVEVRTGNAQGITSSINKNTIVAALPAVNHPRTSAAVGQQKDKTADQLAALVKYSSRIAKIDNHMLWV